MSAAAPTSYVEGPRHGLVTEDNHGDILLIVAWFLMVLMILATFLRLLIRFTTTHVPGLDDAVVFIAMLTGVGSTVSISVSVNKGFGTKIDKLDESQILGLEKEIYITTMLYLFTLSLAKASTLLLIARLVGVKLHSFLIRGVGALVLLWTLGSVFAVAFQCGAHLPWNYLEGKCFNPVVFWDIIGIIDILLDVALIALPTLIVWNLHMNWQRKLIVVSAFAFRIVVIGAAIARLVYIRQLHNSSDPTFEGLPYAITTQLQATLCVVVACIPALKPYMDRAQSGFLNVSLEPRAVGGTYGYDNSFHMRSVKGNGGTNNNNNDSKNNTSQNGTQKNVKPTSNGNGHPLRPDRVDHSATISSGLHDARRRDDDGSSEDGAGSEKYIIQKTQAWNVSYEEDGHQQPEHEHTVQENGYAQHPRASQERPSADIIHAISSV